MSSRINTLPRADADLDDHADCIARGSLKSARRFYEAAEATFQYLVELPEIGQRCEFRSPAAQGLRMWPIRGFPNHIIFYRPTELGIVVVRILHGSRDLEAIFNATQ